MVRQFPALLLLLAAASGQDRAGLLRQVDLEKKAGRTAAMEPLLEQLVARDPNDVPALESLARVELVLAKYDRSRELDERILGIVEAANGKTSPALLAPLSNLVRLEHIAGRFEAAETALLRLIAIRVKETGATHPDVAGDYALLARLYGAQKKFAQSANVYGWALEILEKNFGLDDSRLLVALDGLASSWRADHQDDKLEAPLLRALSIREGSLGPVHPDVAQTLDSLGQLYYRNERLDEAVAAYTRSLAIWTERLGPRHAMVAVSLDNLAVALAAGKKFAEAEKAYREALAIRDEENIASLRNLSLVLMAEEKYKDAEPLLERIVRMVETPSEGLLAVLNDYAAALDHLNKKTAAVRIRGRIRQMEATLKVPLPKGETGNNR